LAATAEGSAAANSSLVIGGGSRDHHFAECNIAPFTIENCFYCLVWLSAQPNFRTKVLICQLESG
jgi:hypothetical protein